MTTTLPNTGIPLDQDNDRCRCRDWRVQLFRGGDRLGPDRQGTSAFARSRGIPNADSVTPGSTSAPWTSTTRSDWSSRCGVQRLSTTRTGCVSPTGRWIMTVPSPTHGPFFSPRSEPEFGGSSMSASRIQASIRLFPTSAARPSSSAALAESEVSYAVLRPAILFGGDGVLINNIAWLLRRLPVFAVGGSGDYRVRGIHVDDLAQLCLQVGAGTDDNVTDAVGPERPTFNELVQSIREAVGARTHIIHVPGGLVSPLSSVLGLALRDVLLTKEEYQAMAAGLADTKGLPTGTIRLSTWIQEHRDALGVNYANELNRHFN